MTEANHNLGDIVRREREKRHMTQAELAEKIEVGSRTIMDIENHRGNPRFDILYRLIGALSISPNLVFSYEQEPIEKTEEKFIQDYQSCSDEEKRLVSSVVSNLLHELRNLKFT